MQQLRAQNRLIIAALLVISGIAAVGFWWLCERSDAIAFLPAEKGAEWIIFPKPLEGEDQKALPVTAVFRGSLTLGARPEKAVLTFRAFKDASLAINDRPVALPAPASRNWKTPIELDATDYLQAGTNVVSVWVTNRIGPPALWLRLTTAGQSLATDENWKVSIGGCPWQNAQLARLPPPVGPDDPFRQTERPLDSLARLWPTLLVCAAAALALVLGLERWARCRSRREEALNSAAVARPSRSEPPHVGSYRSGWPFLLLAVVLVARTVLFIHNAPLLAPSVGFDAEAHTDYVQFIQKNGALPLPNDGFEMHQPPLYYMIGTLVLDVCGLSAANDDATLPLRAINGVAGLAQCWLLLLCLRLLAPRDLGFQCAGLLVGAFLPPQLYLSQYVTNDPLTGLFATAAFYFFLRSLDARGLRFHIAAGLALGAAMLSKFSALPVLAALLAGFGLGFLSTQQHSRKHWLRAFGLMLLSCLLVCGWHYVRIWTCPGQPIIGNWETVSSLSWRQDPGFRTGAFYLRFGQALTSPLFSAVHSFNDGLYSTWWGDGLASGAAEVTARAPWNYDFMDAACVLALGLSLVFLAGFAIALMRFVRRPSPTWFAVLAMLALFGLGILYLSLRVPSPASVKAFYAILAVAPFTAVLATGWTWLARKNRVLATALWVGLMVWVFSVLAAFWIHPTNPQISLVRGVFLARHNRSAEAVQSFSLALRLDDAAGHSGRRQSATFFRAEILANLADALNDQGRYAEAIQAYESALEIKANQARVLNNLAGLRATCTSAAFRDGPEAVRLATRACELTTCIKPIALDTLAAAQAEAGDLPSAIATAEREAALATALGMGDLAKANHQTANASRLKLAELFGQQGKNKEAVAQYNQVLEAEPNLLGALNNLAWLLATDPDEHVRNGARAVELGERACQLTEWKASVLMGTLAAAYAEAGRFADAVATAQKAIDCARLRQEPELAERNQQLLELYKAGKAYHETANLR